MESDSKGLLESNAKSKKNQESSWDLKPSSESEKIRHDSYSNQVSSDKNMNSLSKSDLMDTMTYQKIFRPSQDLERTLPPQQSALKDLKNISEISNEDEKKSITQDKAASQTLPYPPIFANKGNLISIPEAGSFVPPPKQGPYARSSHSFKDPFSQKLAYIDGAQSRALASKNRQALNTTSIGFLTKSNGNNIIYNQVYLGIIRCVIIFINVLYTKTNEKWLQPIII